MGSRHSLGWLITSIEFTVFTSLLEYFFINNKNTIFIKKMTRNFQHFIGGVFLDV